MQFLKNHYEKIILSLVLLGLVGGVVVLFVQVGSVKADLKKKEAELAQVVDKPLDLRPREDYESTLQKMTNPPTLNLTTEHLLFNPFKWVVDSNGKLIKVDREDKLGPGAMKVLGVASQNFTITLSRVSGSGDNPSYQISTKRGADKGPRNHYVRLNDKARPFPFADTEATFTVKEVQGEPANPTALILEFEKPEHLGGTVSVTVSLTEPYIELESREADLSYPPEGRTFPRVKVEDTLTLGGDSYKVIAITDRQVIFEAQNKKRTIIDYTSTVPQ